MFDNANPEKIRRRHPINGRAIVMYTGVLNAFQRIDYLLRAFAVVSKQLPDTLLMMVSALVSESHQREHQKLADQLGISDAIMWMAPHSLEDLPSYLAVASVTVVSRPDCPGHPIKLLNYMLAGKPIVCFAGAAKGVRHLHDAFIVPDHDCDALGRGIITLLKDRALAARLGANARTTVLANFDWRRICQRIEHIYDRLLGNPESRDIHSEHHALARLRP
jgi:1,2-diacylglycerol 3-alpha-glucosyltransferase